MRKPSNDRASNVTPFLTTDDGREIELDTPAFLDWLEANDSFRFDAGFGGEDGYRARKEFLSGVYYWYAVKKVNNKLHKRFIGKTNEVTHNRLIEVAQNIRQPAARQPKLVSADVPAPTAQPALADMSVATALTEQIAELKQLVIQQQHSIEELAGKLKAR